MFLKSTLLKMCYGTELLSKLCHGVFQNDTAVCIKVFAPQIVSHNMNDKRNMLMDMWKTNGKGSHITLFIFYGEFFQ